MNWYYAKPFCPTNEEMFVFGSNLAGRHGKGAALVAQRLYGAIRGIGVGPVNQSYAIPTKDYDLSTLPIEHIVPYIHEFVQYTQCNQGIRFYVTAIGCGLARYTPADIAPHFSGAINCIFPESFRVYLI